MANCPGCGKQAAFDVAEDAEGRIWHRECLGEHERGSPTSLPKTPAHRKAEQERLVKEVHELRTKVDNLKVARNRAENPVPKEDPQSQGAR